MRTISMTVLFLALGACGGAKASELTEQVYRYRWSPSPALCQSDHVTFSDQAIQLTKSGRSDGQLKVRKVVLAPDQPNAMMFIIEAASAGDPAMPLAAMVFKLDGDKLTLIGEGTPSHLMPVTSAEKNFRRFNLQRCG
jgi:hypothetical protein